MTEQPTWEKIERALCTRYRDRTRNQSEVVDWAARQYLAFLDTPTPPSDCHVYKNIYGFWCFACSFKTEQDANAMLAKYAPAPSAEPEFATRSEGFPKDGTRGPQYNDAEIIKQLRQAAIRTGQIEGILLTDAADRLSELCASPPVPQEGVSEEMLDRAIEGYWCNATENSHRKALRRALEAAIAPLLDENARLSSRLSQTSFDTLTAANEMLRKRANAAEARVKELEAYAKHERSLGAEAVAIEALGIQQNLEARAKELEALQDNTQTALDTCMRQLNDAEDLIRKLRKL